MRLAVVSDVHGNLTALDAVAADIARRGVERAVHAGDLALIGARPAEVIDRVAELGWEGIVGNTDDLLWRPEQLARQIRLAPKLEPLLRMLFEWYAPVTRDALGDQRLAWLRAQPADLSVGGTTLVHAAPGDLWRAPMPDATDAELETTYRQLGARVAIYGHIHRPHVRCLNGLTIANAGSVGLPWDGDARASYLLIDRNKPEIVRVEYDIEAEIRALRRSRYPDSERIAEMLRRGRFVPIGDR
jgi:predicted phosphodiesterase